jgi:deazaflavin-dependent oxidoreductase (nitroreductase family)
MPTVQHLVRSIVAPLSRTRLFRAVAPTALPPIERVLHRVSRGRLQLSALLVPSLVLHSTGAKSGRPRESALMYTPDGHGRAIVAGTSFAREHHPAWTYNLLAHPEADIVVRGRRLHVRAALIGADARDEAWRRIEGQWPGYRGYERDSGRTVRLFLLRPVAERATMSVTGTPVEETPVERSEHGRHAE